MSRLVPVWLCAVVALVALTAASLMHIGPVLAASGTLSMETPLHDSPDPAAPVIALLPEGTVVSIDGPPVEGFYPVTAADLSGWMRGETVQLEKDSVASDAPEEMVVEAPLDETGETVPVETLVELDPATDPAMATTVEPAADPAADASATMEGSPPAADPASGDETVPTTEPVPADGMTSVNEPVPVDAAEPAPDPASTSDVTPVPTTPDGAVPPPDSAAHSPEVAVEPTIDANVPPTPVTEVAAAGPASVMVDAPILLGPGTDYGVITTAPAGSTVETTGHVIDGYVTVQYAEVTGWVALEHLRTPGALVVETPPAETPPGEPAPPIEMPPGDASPPETLTAQTPTAETPPVAETLVDAAPVDAP
jgi:hypothetical protein